MISRNVPFDRYHKTSGMTEVLSIEVLGLKRLNDFLFPFRRSHGAGILEGCTAARQPSINDNGHPEASKSIQFPKPCLSNPSASFLARPLPIYLYIYFSVALFIRSLYERSKFPALVAIDRNGAPNSTDPRLSNCYSNSNSHLLALRGLAKAIEHARRG